MAISTIVLDTYKQQLGEAQSINLSGSFNGRVGDEQVPLEVHYKERGIPHQFGDTLIPFVAGFVGDLDENKQVTAATGTAVSYTGSRDDVVGLGKVKMSLPGTMFPREGFFYGFLGLETPDHSHRESTFTVWFHVYNGNPDLFVNEAPFRTELQELLDEGQKLLDDSGSQFSSKLKEWQQNVTDMVTSSNTSYAEVEKSIDNAKSSLELIKQQIAAEDLMTTANFGKQTTAQPLNDSVYAVDTSSLAISDYPRFKAWGYYNGAGIPQAGGGYYGVPRMFELSLLVDLMSNGQTIVPKFIMNQIKTALPDYDVTSIEVNKSSDGKWIYLVSGVATIGIQCLNAKFK